MTVKVKICGVRTPAILDAAISAGADYVGLMIFAKSPRHLNTEDAAALAAAAQGRVKTVAVMVDPDDGLIDEVARQVRPDYLQLHGMEPPERVRAVKARSGLPVIKAVHVGEAADVARQDAYAMAADQILFDAKAAPGAVLPGGNGVAFDWGVLSGARAPFALSGGLHPGNVADAVRETNPEMVDVSSGVETAPGVKDAALITEFIQAARAAARTQAKLTQAKAS